MLFLSIPSTRETTASVWASFVLDVDPVSVVIIMLSHVPTRTTSSWLGAHARGFAEVGRHARGLADVGRHERRDICI